MKGLEIRTDRYLFSYIGLIFMLFYYQLSDTVLYSASMEYCLIFSLLLFILQFVLQNQYRLKAFVIILTLLGIFAFQYKLGHDSRILALIITLLGLKEIPLKKIMKIILYEKIILIIGIALVTALGVGFIPRTNEYTLGFTHGNLFMISVLEIFLLYICLNWKKMGMTSNIIVALLIAVTFFVSRSRTGLLLFTLSFVLYLHIKYGKLKKLRYLNIIAVVSPTALFLISIFIPYSMNKDFFDRNSVIYKLITNLDNLLSKRLRLSSARLKNTSFHLFSSTTDESQMRYYKYQVVDSGYVQLILVYGILGSILFLLFYTLLIKMLCKMDWLGKEKYIYLLSVFIMSLYAFTENSLCSLKYNFTLLFALMLLENEQLLRGIGKFEKLKIRSHHVRIKC